MVIYGYLDKVTRKHSTSKSDVSTVTGQNNIELASVYSTNGNVSANDVAESTSTSSLNEATTNKLCKVEELMGTIIEKLEDILQKSDQAERKLKKHIFQLW